MHVTTGEAGRQGLVRATACKPLRCCPPTRCVSLRLRHSDRASTSRALSFHASWNSGVCGRENEPIKSFNQLMRG